MIPGLDLGVQRSIAAQHTRQDLFSRLDQSFGPARLLRLERGHLHGQLGGHSDILQIDKLPSLELGAIGKIGIFGERVVLPAAGFVDRRPPPHSGGAVEVKEDAAAGASGVLEHEVAVEQDGFHLREKRIIAVDVRPARLHHADLGIGEVMDGAQQKIFRRREVGVENGDEFAFRCLQALG